MKGTSQVLRDISGRSQKKQTDLTLKLDFSVIIVMFMFLPKGTSIRCLFCPLATGIVAHEALDPIKSFSSDYTQLTSIVSKIQEFVREGGVFIGMCADGCKVLIMYKSVHSL